MATDQGGGGGRSWGGAIGWMVLGAVLLAALSGASWFSIEGIQKFFSPKAAATNPQAGEEDAPVLTLQAPDGATWDGKVIVFTKPPGAEKLYQARYTPKDGAEEKHRETTGKTLPLPDAEGLEPKAIELRVITNRTPWKASGWTLPVKKK